MEVTQADLQRNCAKQHAAFVQCSGRAPAEERDSVCAAERQALEACATSTVALVRAINASCGGLYTAYEQCCQSVGSRNISMCEPKAQAFWQCAERASPEPLL